MWSIQMWFLEQLSIARVFSSLVGVFASGGLLETCVEGACLLTLVFEDKVFTVPRNRCAKCARHVFSSAHRFGGSQPMAT